MLSGTCGDTEVWWESNQDPSNSWFPTDKAKAKH